MSRRDKWRVFEDEGKHLDRFGVVLVLSAFSVSALALIDLEPHPGDLRSDIGWAIVLFSVAATLIAAIRASGVRRRWRTLAWIAIGAVLVGFVVFTVFDQFTSWFAHVNVTRPSVFWVAIAAVSPILVLFRILRHESVTRETLFGAVAVYLLLALAFSYLFLYFDLTSVDHFFGAVESTSSYMYFSLITITTVGYGDLSPKGDLARYLASAEAIMGQVLLVTVVARTVSLYARSDNAPKRPDTSGGAPS